MPVLIVVESMFGNTRTVAEHVCTGLRSKLDLGVDVVDVNEAPEVLPMDVPLVIVGAPTHAFGMSRQSSRQEAVKHGAPGPVGRGVREWLEVLRDVPQHLPAAAFDTRVHKPFVPGSAAKAVARRLEHHGCFLVVRPETFYVADTQGPLNLGEGARAEAWGADIAEGLERRAGIPA